MTEKPNDLTRKVFLAKTAAVNEYIDATRQPAAPPAPADRAEIDSLAREADRLRKDWVEMRTRAERLEAEVERLRIDQASVLREAAADLEAWDPTPSERWTEAERNRYEDGVDAAADRLRRRADEAQRSGESSAEAVRARAAADADATAAGLRFQATVRRAADEARQAGEGR